MTTNYQYLHPALVLSPSCKALTQLENEQVCIVRAWETPEETVYFTSVIDFTDGEEMDLGYEFNLERLESALQENVGPSITPYQRIWIPLEWWEPPT